MTALASETVLAYFPSPPQGVWHLGPIPIRAYAFFIIAGIVLALLIGDRRYVARGGEKGVIYDVALWIVPLGLIGGRLYHLATDWQTYWGPGGAGLGAALRIWDGGLGIWGAVALGAVGAWIGCRRHGMELPTFLDAVAPDIVLAQAIGRLGNYFNQELYGRPTTVPWGMEIFDRQDSAGFIDVHLLDGVSTGHVHAVVHPTFLYELLWNLLVFVVLLYLDRRFSLGHGRLFAAYVALYCIGRFGVELLRDDTATHIAGIRVNSFTSTFVFIGAVVYLILAPKGREDRDTEKVSDEADVDEEAPQPKSKPVAVGSTAAVTAAATAAAGHDEADDAADSGQDDEDTEPASVTDEVAEPETVQAEVDEAGDVDETETETEVEDVATAADSEVEDTVADADADAEAEAALAEPEIESAEAESEPEAAEGEPELAADDAEPEVAEAESEPEAVEGEPELETEETEPEAADGEPQVEPADGEPEREAKDTEDAEPEAAGAEPEVEPAEGEPELEAKDAEDAEPEISEAEPKPEAEDAAAAETEQADPLEAVADEAAVVEAATAQVEEPEIAEPEQPDVAEAEPDQAEPEQAEPEQPEFAAPESETTEAQPDSPTDETDEEAEPTPETDAPETETAETAEPDTDETPEHEPASDDGQPPAGGAARQRWRLRLRRQRP